MSFHGLSQGDLADLERSLALIGRLLSDSEPGAAAVRALLLALDIHRAHGHRSRGAATIRLFSGQDDPDEEALARERLVAALQVGRDQTFLSDALRVFLNDLLIELVDARKAIAAETDAIRRLFTAPASRH